MSPLNFAAQEPTSLLDQSRLGSFKIEKLIYTGLFVGAKQYFVAYTDAEELVEHPFIENPFLTGKIFPLKHEARLKGVPPRDRLESDIFHIYREVSVDPLHLEETRASVLNKPISAIFSNRGATITIHSSEKTLCPTFTKRVHTINQDQDSSRPF